MKILKTITQLHGKVSNTDMSSAVKMAAHVLVFCAAAVIPVLLAWLATSIIAPESLQANSESSLPFFIFLAVGGCGTLIQYLSK